MGYGYKIHDKSEFFSLSKKGKNRMLKIAKIEVGELQCNCYLVEKNNTYLLIDPGDEYQKIVNFIQGKKIVGILITHGHFDHIGCLQKLEEDFHYPVYQYSNLKEGNLSIGNFSLEVIFTKGHSNDSVCYYFKENKVMFVGDFIFKGTIGRCDLEGGNFNEMLQSLQKIKQYNQEITLYPGHGEKTTLQEELENNPYFKYIP